MAEAAVNTPVNETPLTPVAPAEPGAGYEQALGDAYDRAMSEGDSEAAPEPRTATRDTNGRYAKQDPADASPQDGEAGEGAAPAPVSERVSAPSGLPLYLAHAWQDIPEQHRGLIEKWATENNNKMADLGRKAAAAADMQPIYDDMLQSYPERFSGPDAIQPRDAVKFLYQVQKDMDARPVETLLEIAARYNAVPELARALGLGNDQTAQTQALQNTIQQLEARIASMISPETINNHIHSAMSQQKLSESVSSFATSKPFFADVEPVLPQFIEIARNMNPEADPIHLLESAYDMAVNSLPAVRERAQAASRAAAVPDPRAAAAKKAASINVKSTAAGRSRPRSQEEAMAEVYDRLMAS